MCWPSSPLWSASCCCSNGERRGIPFAPPALRVARPVLNVASAPPGLPRAACPPGRSISMCRWLPTLLALLLLAPGARAQLPQALDLVPDEPLGFIVIRDLGQLSRKVEQLGTKLHAEQKVSLLELIRDQMGVRDGLKEDGSAIFIVLKGIAKDVPADAVAALPVTDARKVLQQLGVKGDADGIHEGAFGGTSPLLFGVGAKKDGAGKGEAPAKTPVLVARKGSFVLLALPKHRQALERVLQSTKGIASAVQPARGWLAEQDIAGICTDKGVQVGIAMMLGTPWGGAASDTRGQ